MPPPHGIVIKLDRASSRNVYHQGEHVTGKLVLENSYELRHDGVLLSLDGFVDINANYKGINLLFDTLNGSSKTTRTLPLVELTYELIAPGRLEPGKTIVPFKIPIDASVDTPTLYETYHGVYISIQYLIRCRVKRSFFFKDLIEAREIVIEYDPRPIGAPVHIKQPLKFEITPDSLRASAAAGATGELHNQQQRYSSAILTRIPDFKISGQLDSVVCLLGEPITGEFQIESCQEIIKSIELQLVRVETIGGSGGPLPTGIASNTTTGAMRPARISSSSAAVEPLAYSREPTEVQSIQIGDGNPMRKVPISIYMVLPRLFTCATLIASTFRVEFEINLVIIFANNHLVSENFPIRLIRSTLQPI